MVELKDWQNIAHTLRDLHKALLESARRDYEHRHHRQVTPGELLQLLTGDAHFDWLRSLSELIVDIEMLGDAEASAREPLAGAVRPAIEHLLAPAVAGTEARGFAARYAEALQDPHVAMAHAALKQALVSWPVQADADAAGRLHERHRLAEAARHRTRPRHH